MVTTLPSILFLILGPLVPSCLWLFLFFRGDEHPEPKRLILAAFNVGALVSIPVLILQIAFQKIAAQGNADAHALLLIAGLAFIEEVFKFLGIFLFIRRSAAFDEPVDAMVYLIAAALGFATVENFFITLNLLQSAGAFPLSSAIQTLALRFTGATLLHTLSAGIVGYAWAKERFLHSPRELVAWGILIATVVHSIFNYLILKYEDTSLLYPSIFLIVTAFFVVSDFEKLQDANINQ